MDGERLIVMVETNDQDASSPGVFDAKRRSRYQLADPLGTTNLEIAENGQHVISYEETYAYGESSVLIEQSAPGFSLKRWKYNGKERDQAETGLYYYGLRYYAPWLGRWISVDPLAANGESSYGYVRNRPVSLVDQKGAAPGDPEEEPDENVIEDYSKEPTLTPDDFIRLHQKVWSEEDELAEARSELKDLEWQFDRLKEEEDTLSREMTAELRNLEEGAYDVTLGTLFLGAGLFSGGIAPAVALAGGSIAIDEMTGPGGANGQTDAQDYALEIAGVAGDIVEEEATTAAGQLAGKAGGAGAGVIDIVLDYLGMRESESKLEQAQRRLPEIGKSKLELAKRMQRAERYVQWREELLEGAKEDLAYYSRVAIFQWKASGGNMRKAPNWIFNMRPIER
jgi:RHS repeat-associated protein